MFVDPSTPSYQSSRANATSKNLLTTVSLFSEVDLFWDVSRKYVSHKQIKQHNSAPISKKTRSHWNVACQRKDWFWGIPRKRVTEQSIQSNSIQSSWNLNLHNCPFEVDQKSTPTIVLTITNNQKDISRKRVPKREQLNRPSWIALGRIISTPHCRYWWAMTAKETLPAVCDARKPQVWTMNS